MKRLHRSACSSIRFPWRLTRSSGASCSWKSSARRCSRKPPRTRGSAGVLARVAESRYGPLGQADRELEEAQQRLAELQKDGRMLKEEVDEEDIAALVSKWTGIPVGRLLEAETQK